MSKATCEQHRDEILAAIESNREQEIAPIQSELDGTLVQEQRERLQYEIDQIWDHDEEQQAIAGRVWRDCLAHLRDQK